ncbi:thiamine pyrophosphate-binding protein [Nonomuraea sp. NPDC049625]|uniref:thiamine pyrophosphate-binding protein n=1 Tax=Nonomuraea sp. NPDC049625 TaxID=3155775 RepID=UPI0034338082
MSPSNTATTGASGNGAEGAAAVLQAWGVRQVFGVPGGHNLPLFAAIEAEGIEAVGARHEQGAGFLAEAFAKLAGCCGVVVTTAGPGITNTLTPLAQANAESVPLCVLALDNYAETLSEPDGTFHAISDLRSASEPFAHWAGTAQTPDEVAPLVDRALRLAASTSRPAIVQLPSDMLTKPTQNVAALPAPGESAPAPGEEHLDALASLLREADRPILFTGAGAVRSGAQAEVLELAQTLGAPVVTTVQGRGIIPEDHELALGPVWDRFGPRDEIACAADLVVCLGTSLAPLATRNGGLPLGRMVHVDIDPSRPGRLYKPELAIRGDVKDVLRRLLDRRSAGLGATAERGSFVKESLEHVTRWHASFRSGAPLIADLLDGIREGSPRETAFVSDMTVVGYWAQRFLPVYASGGLISPYYFGTLGYGVPAAVGAKVAVGDAPVVALCGDAGFLMNSQEMATSNLHDLPVHVVLFNDNGYGAVHADVRRNRLPELSVARITNPSFELLAQAYGWRYQKTEADRAQIAEALGSSIGEGASSITEVIVPSSLAMPYEIAW